jgi:hypothetical protein
MLVRLPKARSSFPVKTKKLENAGIDDERARDYRSFWSIADGRICGPVDIERCFFLKRPQPDASEKRHALLARRACCNGIGATLERRHHFDRTTINK